MGEDGVLTEYLPEFRHTDPTIPIKNQQVFLDKNHRHILNMNIVLRQNVRAWPQAEHLDIYHLKSPFSVLNLG